MLVPNWLQRLAARVSSSTLASARRSRVSRERRWGAVAHRGCEFLEQRIVLTEEQTLPPNVTVHVGFYQYGSYYGATFSGRVEADQDFTVGTRDYFLDFQFGTEASEYPGFNPAKLVVTTIPAEDVLGINIDVQGDVRVVLLTTMFGNDFPRLMANDPTAVDVTVRDGDYSNKIQGYTNAPFKLSLYGGGGNDTLFGGSGNDLLEGGYGYDSLSGFEGNDTLIGGMGNDDDTLFGGPGDDTFHWGWYDAQGGHGPDVMIGSEGNDSFYLEGKITNVEPTDAESGSPPPTFPDPNVIVPVIAQQTPMIVGGDIPPEPTFPPPDIIPELPVDYNDQVFVGVQTGSFRSQEIEPATGKIRFTTNMFTYDAVRGFVPIVNGDGNNRVTNGVATFLNVDHIDAYAGSTATTLLMTEGDDQVLYREPPLVKPDGTLNQWPQIEMGVAYPTIGLVGSYGANTVTINTRSGNDVVTLRNERTINNYITGDKFLPPALNLGDGDDTLLVEGPTFLYQSFYGGFDVHTQFSNQHGGNGRDTIRLQNNHQRYDLYGDSDGFEVMDITGDGANAALLNPDAVSTMAPDGATFTLLRNSDDDFPLDYINASLSRRWYARGTTVVDGTRYDRYESPENGVFLNVNSLPGTPSLSPIAPVTIDEDQSTVAIPFSLDDSDTLIDQLTVAVSAVFFRGYYYAEGTVQLQGAGRDRTLSITPPQDLFGSTVVTVTVSDGTNSTKSEFLLTVNPVNDAPTFRYFYPLDANTVRAGETVPARYFDAADLETTSPDLVYTATSSNLELIPSDGFVFGTNANYPYDHTLNVTPATGKTGTATITVTVSDGELTDIRQFDVTVLPAQPIFSIAQTDASKSEGNNGSKVFSFTVTRSGDTSGSASVRYAVTGSGSHPADASDFGGALPNETVTFDANESSKTVTINVRGDKAFEDDEDFTVTLSEPSTGAIIDPTAVAAVGTILNDDTNANLRLDSITLSDRYGNLVVDPVIGEELFVRALWSTRDLPANSQYQFTFEFDGVSLQSSSFTAGAGISGELVRSFIVTQGGWHLAPGSHTLTATIDSTSAVDEADDNDNVLTMTVVPVQPVTLREKFVIPIGGTPFVDFSIPRYVNVDPRPGHFQDFDGGPLTYQAHKGIDFFVSGLENIDHGVPVFAAAAGTVEFAHDGEFDRPQSNFGPTNYVRINHGNGWVTEYYHLSQNTITVRAGDVVSRGQIIGGVGSSGASFLAHLHFAVRHNAAQQADPWTLDESAAFYVSRYQYVEPWLDAASYFVSPLPYQGDTARSLLEMTVSNYWPGLDRLEQASKVTDFPTNMNWPVYTGLFFSHLIPGDQFNVKWFDPQGILVQNSPVAITSENYDDPQHALSLSQNLWSQTLGQWTVSVEINGNEVARRHFNVISGQAAPAMRLLQEGTRIANGRTTPVEFGTANLNGTPATKTFTIENHGSSVLATSGVVIPTGFALVGNFPSSLDANSTTTFSVRLDTTRAGDTTGTIRFSTNDPETNSFAFVVHGLVTGMAPVGAPVLGLPGPAVAYTFGTPAQVLDALATFDDSDSPNLGNGLLRVLFDLNGTAGDVLSVRNQGTGTGQIGVSGSNVTYQGSVIGTKRGGIGLAPLEVTFENTATIAAVQALLRNVTYENTEISRTSLSRSIRFAVIDGNGNTSNQPLQKIVFPLAVSVTMSSNSAFEGASLTGTVSRSQGDADSDLVVALNTSDATAATVPAMVIIPHGQATATFVITATDDTLVDGSQSVAVTAEAIGYLSGASQLAVLDNEPQPIDLKYSVTGSTVVTTTVLASGHVQVTLGTTIQADVNPASVRSLTINGGSGADTINLTGLSRSLYSALTSIVLNGNAGNDKITGSAAFSETISGGAGTDTLVGGTRVGIVDHLVESGNNATATLTNTTLTGHGLTALVTESVTGFEEASLTGGTGSNTINASSFSGPVTLIGGGGNDVLTGGVFADVLDGGIDNDVLMGNAGEDQLEGGAGTDKLTGGAGNDVLDGGDGADTVIASGGTAYELTDTSLSGDGDDTLSQIEAASLTLLAAGTASGMIDASAFSGIGINTLTGGNGNDTILGGVGRDSIKGGGGNDVLSGGLGNDVLSGGLGSDVLDGGKGALDLLEENGDVDFKLTNTVLTGLGTDAITPSTIEQVRLTGGASNNRLDASAFSFGTVTLNGGEGHDVLLGGTKNDSLIGGGGRDLLIGGTGIDSLTGGAGDDILIGGTIVSPINTVAARTAIMAEWTSAGSLVSRQTKLLNGGGLNGANRLNSTTVKNDSSAKDSLTGNADTDWFFQFAGDMLIDFNAGDIKTAL